MFFYLAPIQGITDCGFRNIYCSHFKGIDCCMAPFVSAVKQDGAGRKLLRDILPENKLKNTVIPQILGNTPETIAGTANAIMDLGYDEVNLNLGCPYPMVTKKNRGSGLLRDIDGLDRLLEGIFTFIKPRLSIKTRAGFENHDEITRLMDVFNRYPVSEIIIHPRVASQMYSGKASPDSFLKAEELCRHRLVYNGDICSQAYFSEIREKLPRTEKWMIGRAIISNPFLPEMLKNNTAIPCDACERFFRFHDELFLFYREKFSGPAHLVDRMKAFWRYFCISIKDGKDIAKKINKTKTEKSYIEVTDGLRGKIVFIEIRSPLLLK